MQAVVSISRDNVSIQHRVWPGISRYKDDINLHYEFKLQDLPFKNAFLYDLFNSNLILCS